MRKPNAKIPLAQVNSFPKANDLIGRCECFREKKCIRCFREKINCNDGYTSANAFTNIEYVLIDP